MKQVLLCGTKRYGGMAIEAWASDDVKVGQQVRWNGAPWDVRAEYGTRFCPGGEAQRTERPNENPLIRLQYS